MDIKENNNICTICLQTFSKKKRDLSSSLHYRKLCDQFTSDGDLPGYHGGTLLICLNCLACVSSTLGKRDQVTSGELEVRKLQVQILKLLGSLQSKIDGFKEEMGKMEMIVEGGCDKVKELDDFYVEKGADLVGTSLKDAIQFRDKILTVVEDLRAFSKDLIVVKDPTELTTDSVRKSTSSEKMSQDNRSDEQVLPVSPDSDNFCEDDNGSEDDISIQGSDKGPCSEERPDDDDKRGSESESDPEFIPGSWKTKKKKKQDNRLASSILSIVDFTGMSDFKKKFITRIIHKFEKHQNAKQPLKYKERKYRQCHFADIDPLKTHFIQYDPATDSLNLSGMEITVNEKEESLQCSKCGFQTRQKEDQMDISMYSHILGHHLNIFTCHICGTRLTSYNRFKGHILGHNNQFDCDICGKSFAGKDVVRRHKWSHMNEEEKAEAVKSGLKPPEEMRRRRKMEKQFQCSTCGKEFIYMSMLKKHEVIHQEERKYMCTHCGATFKLNGSLSYHLKYVCFPGKGKVSRATVLRFQCDQCLMKFPLESRLRQHKAVNHSELPNSFKCSMCEKAFKTKQRLKLHVTTHSDARPHQCKKCGATYKTRTNCWRHEKKCQNTGVE